MLGPALELVDRNYVLYEGKNFYILIVLDLLYSSFCVLIVIRCKVTPTAMMNKIT